MINSILIGEDNFVAQRLLLTVLERKYSKVIAVSTCAEILSALELHRFDLLLLDYHLDRDANFIIREITKRGLGTDLLVFVISAEPEASIIEKLKGLKFEGYLPKSATEADLDRAFGTIAPRARTTDGPRMISGEIDLTNLGKLLDNNPQKLTRIVSIFIKDATVQLARMEELLWGENFAELKRVVHRAKAAYGYLGLHTVTKQLTDWELSIEKQADMHLHYSSFNRIKEEVNHIIYELTKNYLNVVDLTKPSGTRKEHGKET